MAFSWYRCSLNFEYLIFLCTVLSCRGIISYMNELKERAKHRRKAVTIARILLSSEPERSPLESAALSSIKVLSQPRTSQFSRESIEKGVPEDFYKHFLHLGFHFEIIVYSHAVVINDAEKFHAFSPSFSNGHTLHTLIQRHRRWADIDTLRLPYWDFTNFTNSHVCAVLSNMQVLLSVIPAKIQNLPPKGSPMPTPLVDRAFSFHLLSCHLGTRGLFSISELLSF